MPAIFESHFKQHRQSIVMKAHAKPLPGGLDKPVKVTD